MIKAKIFEKCKKYFEDYLFGFDQDHLRTSILAGNIDLHNVNIRPDKVNELFAKKKLPIALKAGLISQLRVKLNLISLFTDSLRITVEDLLFIVGPNITHMSTESDFENDINSPYDESNPLNNLIKMHKRALDQEKKLKQIEKEKEREEKKKQAEKNKEKAATKKKKKEFKEPPMKIIINLLGGLKLEIKRVHFRYEDDYFQHHKPFAFGLMIENISMDNSDTDWNFENPLQMGFTRSKPVNSGTINKELNIKNVKVYWNSMSEMFVPTSLWEQTRHLEHQIFDAMDASFLKELLVDAFSDKQTFAYHYLVSPFTIYTSINLNKSYVPNTDPYKYQINTLISAINVNLSPQVVRDILKFKSFLEMFSYANILKKYRPLFRVQSFLEQPAKSSQLQKKKAAVIRDWFQFVLWYIRLRKASKGATPYKLLEVEQYFQGVSLQNALMKAKRANLQEYEFYLGSSDEEETKDPNALNTSRTEDLDVIAQYEKQQEQSQKMSVIREMLTGFKFQFRLEGVNMRVFTNKKIKKQQIEIPNLEFNIDMLSIFAGIQGQNLIAKVLLKEIRLIDYFKRDVNRSMTSRQVYSTSRQHNYHRAQSQADERGRTSQQLRESNGQGAFSGMTGVINKLFDRPSASQNAFNTPGKSMRFTDIIYGSSARERQNMSSQQMPYDFFSLEIPDPTQAHDKTRETLTISDVLRNSQNQQRAESRQVLNEQAAKYNQSMGLISDNSMNNSPTRATKVQRPQIFKQSPTKGQERVFTMNNVSLNQRSEIFVDDHLDSIDKRCFLLMCGKVPNIDSAISIDISFNIFDEPGLKKKITLSFCLDQFIIEYCNEILQSLTSLGLQYKLAFNYADLANAKGPSKLNKKRGLQTTLQYQAPLYTIRQLMLRQALNVSDEAIKNYQKNFYTEKQKKKSKSEQMREMKEKQLATIQKIKDIDKKLNDINFDINIALKAIQLGLTGDHDDVLTSNQTLLEFGIENQSISLLKEDFKCKVSVFGISVTTLNSLEMLFIFANRLKKTATVYKDDLAVLTSIQHYKDFIQNIKKNMEKQNKQKMEEEEREYLRKVKQPQILVSNDPSQIQTRENMANKNNNRFYQDKSPIQVSSQQQRSTSNQNQLFIQNQNQNNMNPDFIGGQQKPGISVYGGKTSYSYEYKAEINQQQYRNVQVLEEHKDESDEESHQQDDQQFGGNPRQKNNFAQNNQAQYDSLYYPLVNNPTAIEKFPLVFKSGTSNKKISQDAQFVCQLLAIHPEDLFPRDCDQFAEKGLPTLRQQLRYEHYEEKRLLKLRAIQNVLLKCTSKDGKDDASQMLSLIEELKRQKEYSSQTQFSLFKTHKYNANQDGEMDKTTYPDDLNNKQMERVMIKLQKQSKIKQIAEKKKLDQEKRAKSILQQEKKKFDKIEYNQRQKMEDFKEIAYHKRKKWESKIQQTVDERKKEEQQKNLMANKLINQTKEYFENKQRKQKSFFEKMSKPDILDYSSQPCISIRGLNSQRKFAKSDLDNSFNVEQELKQLEERLAQAEERQHQNKQVIRSRGVNHSMLIQEHRSKHEELQKQREEQLLSKSIQKKVGAQNILNNKLEDINRAAERLKEIHRQKEEKLRQQQEEERRSLQQQLQMLNKKDLHKEQVLKQQKDQQREMISGMKEKRRLQFEDIAENEQKLKQMQRQMKEQIYQKYAEKQRKLNEMKQLNQSLQDIKTQRF